MPIQRRVERLEAKQSYHEMKPYASASFTDDEDPELAIDKVCKEQNISRDTHTFYLNHYISVEYADRQKALGNWPLPDSV